MKLPISLAVCSPLLFCSLLAMVLSTVNPATVLAEGPGLPTQELALRFDTADHRLTAAARIVLPAGSGTALHLDGLEITAITINNEPCVTVPENHILEIAAAAREQEIIIDYQKTAPPAGQNARDLISPDGITLTGFWLPVPDEDMLFSLTADLPAGFAAVSEADEVIAPPTAASGGETRVSFRCPHPTRAINFVAGPYLVHEENFGNGKTLASYFFAEDDGLAAGYRNAARRYLDRYEKLLGPYPYQRFAIVENRLPTGYAMPGFTLLGQAVVRLPFITETSLGHETLHAWFGNSVRIKPGEGNWAEGLTAYLADHAFAADEGRDQDFRKEQLIKYRSYVPAAGPMTLAQFGGAEDSSAARETVRAIGYSKAAMVFHMLRKKVGDDFFYQALRDFYARMKFKPAGWSDLRVSFEDASHMDLAEFFDQWLIRPDIPDLAVKEIKLSEKEGRPLLSFKLAQSNKTPLMLTMPVSIKNGQEKLTRQITVTGAETAVEMPFDTPPAELVIDGEYDLMRQLTPAELPPTWSRFAGAANKIVVVDKNVDPDLFKPFLEILATMECKVLPEEQATSSELAKGSVIFLGTGSASSRALFARPAHADGGFTVDVRANPLNPAEVAVLAAASSQEQVTKGVAKLAHYGKYSFLHFEDGRIQDKQIASTENGMRFILDTPPKGMATSQAIPFAEIVDQLAASRVLYVGENHTSYEDHLLQLRLIRALYERDPQLAIGMEMFPRAAQSALDDYTAGRIDEKTFLKKSAYFKVWSFDYRLYREIINFARRHQIPVIALNLDRDVVSEVFKTGDTTGLAAEAREELPADRDLDMPGYRGRIEQAFRMHAGQGSNERFGGFLQAQALWDETMAETAADYLRDHPAEKLVIIAGQGHVNKESGIPPRLARRLGVSQTVVVNASGANSDPAATDFQFFSPPVELSPPPLLGVQLAERAEKDGVTVAELSPHGQAEKAGLRARDIILAIDDQAVAEIGDVKIAMLYKEQATSARVRVRRLHAILPDEVLEFEVSLKRQPSPH